jgi:hypothetical protein
MTTCFAAGVARQMIEPNSTGSERYPALNPSDYIGVWSWK